MSKPMRQRSLSRAEVVPWLREPRRSARRSAREVPMTAPREVEEELSLNLGDKRTTFGRHRRRPLAG
eukprot:jgi/Chrpa1/5852/Chrysochromulina_OHIO_Genome00009226-RA